LNSGICNDGTCACPPGYDGDYCGNEQRAKFLANYDFSETCLGGNYTYTAALTISGDGITLLHISDFAALNGSELAGVVYGHDIQIPQQFFAYNGEQWGIVGTGHLSELNLTIIYTLTFPDGSTDECTAIGIRQ